MAEIFRVLFVTLLLNAYWPPSVGEFISGGDLEKMLKGFPPGLKQIVILIMAYMSESCGVARQLAAQAAGDETRTDYTPGQVQIIKLLSSFYSRDCKVGDYVKDISDSDFTVGEKQIFRMLSAFTSSGCSAAAKASLPPGTPMDPQFTDPETGIINVLSEHFLNKCTDPDGDTNRAFGDNSSIRPRNAAGLHVHSVVHDLFLSIIGVCFTRIEL